MLENAVKIDSSSDTSGKEETVYVIADPNGTAQKVIVSEWLKNPDHLDSLTDYSELSDIKNTNGDETYTAADDHSYTWNAGGSDIHYQGTTSKELPVSVKVTYYLNGSEISPDLLAGRSGHVKIRFDYTNTQKVNANITGHQDDIFVPFLMVSGTALDVGAYSNVTVSSGQVINDGNRNVVIGYAFPGMSQSLKTTDEDIDIPEYVEIEADTTGFALPATLTVGMTGLFNNVDFNEDSSLGDLEQSMDDLKEATQELIDGAADLYTGTSLLYDNCQDLRDGAGDLQNGAKQLSSGAAQANAGAADLKNGLGTLAGNSSSLRSGAKDIVDAVFESATTQLRQQLVSSGLMTQSQADGITLTRTNYITVFKQLSSAVAVTPAQVEAQLRAGLSAMTTDQQNLALTLAYDFMTADSSLDVTAAVTQAAGAMADAATAHTACAVIDDAWLAVAEHQDLIAQIVSSTSADTSTAAQIAAIALALDDSNPAGQIGAASVILSHAGTVASTTVSADKITALCTAAANAVTSTGNASLDAVKDQLDDVMEFYNGLLIYTNGVDSAYGGSKDLAAGTSSLHDGADDLYDGSKDLYSGTQDLVTGVGQLKDGAAQLEDGLNKFYDDGIKKLTDTVSGDLTEFLDHLSAVADASRSYQSFAGKPNGMSGSVRFIFRTDSIGE
jgi:putative membrane protein